jgi:hypothetical protein
MQPGLVLCTQLAAVDRQLSTDAPARPRSASGRRPWLMTRLRFDRPRGRQRRRRRSLSERWQVSDGPTCGDDNAVDWLWEGLSGRCRVSLRLMVPRFIPAGVPYLRHYRSPRPPRRRVRPARPVRPSAGRYHGSGPRTSGGWTTRQRKSLRLAALQILEPCMCPRTL